MIGLLLGFFYGQILAGGDGLETGGVVDPLVWVGMTENFADFF